MIGNRILNTRGQITGKPRQTTLGYAYNPSTKACQVMTGWDGRSDWYRNALAEPEVGLWVDLMKTLARANKLTLEENVVEIKECSPWTHLPNACYLNWKTSRTMVRRIGTIRSLTITPSQRFIPTE